MPHFCSCWHNYNWMWLKLWSHYLVAWIEPSFPNPGGFATSKMKQISSSYSWPLCFSPDCISLVQAIQQCPAHWSGRGSVQCGGKWLSRGMIDLNSTMAAPKATQPPLRVMDARMSPITFSSGGENFVPLPKSAPFVPSCEGGCADGARTERNEFCKKPRFIYICIIFLLLFWHYICVYTVYLLSVTANIRLLQERQTCNQKFDIRPCYISCQSLHFAGNARWDCFIYHSHKRRHCLWIPASFFSTLPQLFAMCIALRLT